MASPPPLPERSLPRPPPPPLPPRNNSQLPPPPPYSAVDESRASLASPDQQGPQILLSKVKDPRTSSSQSLVPSDSDSDARRTLLLVYIHGFYGNDQSFRSFPAHVHNFLREALSETHVVHSKVYPRYKTYKAIDVARDNFSAWLEPHESPTTDVILIGHSMGGLLAAEMVLMPSQISSSHSKHWSEGLITALGNHIASHLEFGGCLADYRGLMSRYNQLRALEDVDDLQALNNGTFNNAHTRVRFVNYYTLSSGRPKQPSTTQDSRDISQVDLSTNSGSETKTEDDINKKLADVTISTTDDDTRTFSSPTLSKPSTPAKESELNEPVAASMPKEEKDINHASSSSQLEEPELPIDSNRLSRLSMLSMQEIDPIPMDEAESDFVEHGSEVTLPTISDGPPVSMKGSIDEIRDPSDPSLVSPLDIDLPPIPDLPNPPEQPDFSQYTDKDSRKQAEKEFSRLQKAYENAVKDRSKALREREKLIEKRQKKAQKDAQKDADKQERDLKKQKQKAEQEKRRLEKEEEKAGKAEKKRLDKEAAAAAKQLVTADETKRSAAASSSVASLAETEAEMAGTSKPRKMKKFCTTPSKTNGVMDSTWVSVYMDGMDEVTAHCALFLPGPHYDRLVGDVGGRIVSWVHNDLSVRAMMEMD
ncbi:hypothetical protein TrVFT333_011198 [Trichoderma virens FT-333]|nr:hypothetical protein TrVFT333_011198 [Trichoderma virens FT-333]